MSAENKTTLGQKINKSSISDIAKSIKLNMRIGMTKQLFNGDSELFKTNIEALNNANSLKEAMALLKSIQKNQGLSEDNKWYVRLSHLVERRHL